MSGGVVVGIILDLDALGIEPHRVGDIDVQSIDVQGESAGDIERPADVAAQQGQQIHFDIEGAPDAGERHGDAAAALGPEIQARQVQAQRHAQDQLAAFEAGVREGDRRSIQHQRAKGERIAGLGRIARITLHGEFRFAGGIRPAVHKLPLVLGKSDRNFAVLEQPVVVGGVAVHDPEPIGVARDVGRRCGVDLGVKNARAGERDVVGGDRALVQLAAGRQEGDVRDSVWRSGC